LAVFEVEHFVTLFDSFFLPQGLALHRSMVRELNTFTLWILCVDRKAYEVLEQLKLLNVRLLDLADLETTELIAVKANRTKGEYCWTLTPFAPKFVFHAAPEVDRVTYLDADLWFRSDVQSIFSEFDRSEKGVLITDHLYAAEYDHSHTNGRFCVQFMTFKRDSGEFVRKWWEDRCVEWCFARFEEGKFGDQKYLDDWPVRFSDQVHVLSNLHPVIGPWNAKKFPYSSAFAFHFHGVRVIDRKRVAIADNYDIPEVTFRNVYRKYFVDLMEAMQTLTDAGVTVRSQSAAPTLARRILSHLRRLHWVVRVKFRRSVYDLRPLP
jgi:hypothetical protein